MKGWDMQTLSKESWCACTNMNHSNFFPICLSSELYLHLLITQIEGSLMGRIREELRKLGPLSLRILVYCLVVCLQTAEAQN